MKVDVVHWRMKRSMMRTAFVTVGVRFVEVVADQCMGAHAVAVLSLGWNPAYYFRIESWGESPVPVMCLVCVRGRLLEAGVVQWAIQLLTTKDAFVIEVAWCVGFVAGSADHGLGMGHVAVVFRSIGWNLGWISHIES